MSFLAPRPARRLLTSRRTLQNASPQPQYARPEGNYLGRCRHRPADLSRLRWHRPPQAIHRHRSSRASARSVGQWSPAARASSRGRHQSSTPRCPPKKTAWVLRRYDKSRVSWHLFRTALPISCTRLMFQELPCATGCGNYVPLNDPEVIVSCVKVIGMPSRELSASWRCSSFRMWMRQAGESWQVALGAVPPNITAPTLVWL